MFDYENQCNYGVHSTSTKGDPDAMWEECVDCGERFPLDVLIDDILEDDEILYADIP